MRALSPLTLLGLAGCGLTPLTHGPVLETDSGLAHSDSSDTAQPGTSSGASGAEGGSGGGGGGGGGGRADTPRTPQVGDLVISELMINPSAVEDQFGEWIELASLSSERLNLAGIVLSDDGVDGTAILGTPVLEPGEFIVFCANGTSNQNGGIDCQASYPYASTGDGFALANSEDEVVVSTTDGLVLDRMTYSSGFAPVGRSTGVRSAQLSPSGNDNPGAWCVQTGYLAGGDQGTPGSTNTNC